MDISNSPVDGVGQELGTQQVVQTQEQVVPIKDYKNLESFATTNRQELIETAKRLVEKDKNELNFIKDIKVRDKVVKELYGYESFEELTAVEGSEFATPKPEDNEDELAVLRKKVRKIEYSQATKELENAVAAFKKENPDIFRSQSAEEELRAKLKLIAGDISVEERVRMAGKLAFTPTVDPTTAAYKAMAGMNVGAGGASTADPKTKTDKEKNQDSILEFLKIKKS